jgi:RNA polymerase subunit RPABC4/transcription elongation factor Spt4
MKCKNTIEGEICGAEIPTSVKWCGFCGGKVKVEDDTSFYLNKTCPVCSAEVTKRHKFCTECGSSRARFKLTTLVVINTDYIDSCRSNYHII